MSAFRGRFAFAVGVFIASCLPLFSLASSEAAEKTLEPPFKTAKIVYKITQDFFDTDGKPSMHREGTEIKWVDAVGDRKRIERTWNRNAPEGESVPSLAPSFGEKQLEIVDGNKQYVVDLGLKTGLVTDPPFPARVDQIFHDEYKTGRQETLLGKTCDVYQAGGEICWLWNHLILKREMKIEGFRESAEATQIEEDIEIPEGFFVPPPDVKLQTQEEMLQDVGGSLERIGDWSAKWDETFASLQEWCRFLDSELHIPGLADLDYLETVLYSEDWDDLMEVIRKSPALSDEQKQEKSKRLKAALDEKKKELNAEMPLEIQQSMKAVSPLKWLREARGELGKMSELMLQGAHVNATMVLLACERYRDRNGTYPEDLSRLAEEGLPEDFVEGVTSKDGLQGYLFEYTRTDPQHFELWARSLRPSGKTLFVDETGVFRLDGREGPVYEESAVHP